MQVSFLLLLSSLYGGKSRVLKGHVHSRRVFYLLDIESCSLPGAVGMYGLSLGVQKIGESLPLPVYALLSGLNASIVGIIALAAVQLAGKAIRDKLTRIQVLFGACAGVCYNALWYFPILMLAGGLASVVWDGWMAQRVRKLKVAWQLRHSRLAEPEEAAIPPGANGEVNPVPIELQQSSSKGQGPNTEISQQSASVRSRRANSENEIRASREVAPMPADLPRIGEEEQSSEGHSIQIWLGILLVVIFFGRFFIPCYYIEAHILN